jgi:hypothetical protein
MNPSCEEALVALALEQPASGRAAPVDHECVRGAASREEVAQTVNRPIQVEEGIRHSLRVANRSFRFFEMSRNVFFNCVVKDAQ